MSGEIRNVKDGTNYIRNERLTSITNPVVKEGDGDNYSRVAGSVTTPYIGALDTNTHVADLAVGSQLLYKDNSGYSVEVDVDSTVTSIGFKDNKFDSDTWNTVTNDGANTANITKWVNQNGVDDAVQTVVSERAVISSNGDVHPDGVDDLLKTPSMTLADSATGFSLFCAFTFDDVAQGQVMYFGGMVLALADDKLLVTKADNFVGSI